jgi:hypothetical protein
MLKPTKVIKILNKRHQFIRDYPDFYPFLKKAFGNEIIKDTLIEITVSKPGEEKLVTKIKIEESELPLFEAVKDIFN